MQVHGTRCGPAAFVIGLAQSEFVDPYLARLRRWAQVPDTYYNSLHLRQRRITHHAHLIIGLVGVVFSKQGGVGGQSVGTRYVAFFLQRGKHVHIDIEHILLRPHQHTVGGHIPVVAALRREFQRDKILIVVVLIVGTETNEHGQLIVLQLGAVGFQIVGMHKHLQVLILLQVQRGVLIDSLRLVLRQVFHHQAEGLLIALGQLRLAGVGHTADARRQHVGHRLAVGVFFHVDRTHRHRACLGSGRGHQVLLVLSPLATYQVEAAETQNNVFLEIGEEHTHEADAGKVVDSAHLRVKRHQRHPVLIPAHGAGVAIAQRCQIVTVVYYIRVFRLSPSVVGL